MEIPLSPQLSSGEEPKDIAGELIPQVVPPEASSNMALEDLDVLHDLPDFGAPAMKTGRLRKACDFCTKRKRKCSGGKPCTFCLEMKAHCVYSVKLKSGRKRQKGMPGELPIEAKVGSSGGGGLSGSLSPALYAGGPESGAPLVGHMENYFLATFLSDFNKFVPLVTEETVMLGMLEAVRTRSVDQKTQTRLAVFWGVVAVGSRVLGAESGTTERYVGHMKQALSLSMDASDDLDLVRAFLLLCTLESMRGAAEKSHVYLKFASTAFDRIVERDVVEKSRDFEALSAVMAIYRSPATFGKGAMEEPSSVEQVMESMDELPSSKGSDALRLIVGSSQFTNQILNPETPCQVVKANIKKLHVITEGASDVLGEGMPGECITSIVPVMICGGIARVFRLEEEEGLKEVEEGVQYALSRPSMMQFPLWLHSLHCAGILFCNYGRSDSFNRLRDAYNRTIGKGEKEWPPFEVFTEHVCTEGSHCRAVANWFNRGMQLRHKRCAAQEAAAMAGGSEACEDISEDHTEGESSMGSSTPGGRESPDLLAGGDDDALTGFDLDQLVDLSGLNDLDADALLDLTAFGKGVFMAKPAAPSGEEKQFF